MALIRTSVCCMAKDDASRRFAKYNNDNINSASVSYLRNTPYPGAAVYTQYAMARLGLSPLPNVEPLKRELGSVVNDVTSFRYPISIPSCREVNGRRNIFIAVISAADNFEKRAVIRKTWANYLNSVWNRTLTGFAGFAFILGRTEDGSTQKRIEEENATQKDIIQIDMADVYRNLPMKIAGLLNWIHKNCANFKGFILKIDDDVYLSVRTLQYFIHSYDPFSPSIFGRQIIQYPIRGQYILNYCIILIICWTSSRLLKSTWLQVRYFVRRVALEWVSPIFVGACLFVDPRGDCSIISCHSDDTNDIFWGYLHRWNLRG